MVRTFHIDAGIVQHPAVTPHLDEQHTNVAMLEEVLLLVPDAWAGAPVHVEVEGTMGESVVATGATEVTLSKGETTRARVQLVGAGCVELCTVGDVRCSGDGVAECVFGLTATPATGSEFAGWSGGGCSGIGPSIPIGASSASSKRGARSRSSSRRTRRTTSRTSL